MTLAANEFSSEWQSQVQVLAPADWSWDAFWSAPVGRFFDPLAVEFLEVLSQRLLAPGQGHAGELVALGYWLRPANLRVIRGRYTQPSRYRPLGTLLHVAPGNVPTQFAYSWALGLLAGNRNLVRLSRRRDGVSGRILAEIDYLFSQSRFQPLAQANGFLDFAPDDRVMEALCRHCQGRVLWGSDETVARLRRFPVPADSRELVFPSRFSAACVKAEAVTPEKLATLAERFVQDSLPFAQQGCASPRLLIWVGSGPEIARGQQLFWPAVAEAAAGRFPTLSGAEVMNREVFRQAALMEGATAVTPLLADAGDVGWRLAADEVGESMLRRHPGLGIWLETTVPSLNEVPAVLGDRYQTLTCWGLGPAQAEALLAQPGWSVMRMVPLGQALTFSVEWDGFDVLEAMTHRVSMTL